MPSIHSTFQSKNVDICFCFRLLHSNEITLSK
ncbi:hypothetical protein T11_956 [Trichinella zimbabwensis]|uniref:Uncharacterized protein n=1 Tax=Trichinella zimbabwensis TaxID=268475 RepID=A0A0V1GGS2_9BILA|nr:hypothetical protein T11_956 [Trichinella zimbabwensis]